MAVYLSRAVDPHCRGLLRYHLRQESESLWNLLQEARNILFRNRLDIDISKSGTISDGDYMTPKEAISSLKAAKQEIALKHLKEKIIYGAYCKQLQVEGIDSKRSHLWPVNGRFPSETEALVIAIQDGIVHTNAYRHRILEDPKISILCRSCKESPETIGHLLSGCKNLNWTLHKERHNSVLYQLLVGFFQRYDLELPDSLRWSLDAGMVWASSRAKK